MTEVTAHPAELLRDVGTQQAEFACLTPDFPAYVLLLAPLLVVRNHLSFDEPRDGVPEDGEFVVAVGEWHCHIVPFTHPKSGRFFYEQMRRGSGIDATNRRLTALDDDRWRHPSRRTHRNKPSLQIATL